MIKTLNNLLDKEFVIGKQQWKFLYLFRILDKLVKLYPDNIEIKNKFDTFVLDCDNLCDKVVGADIPLPIIITIEDTIVRVPILNSLQFIDPSLYIQSNDLNFSYDNAYISNVLDCQIESSSNFMYIGSSSYAPPLYYLNFNIDTPCTTSSILAVEDFTEELVEDYTTKVFDSNTVTYFKKTTSTGYPDGTVFYVNLSELGQFLPSELNTIKSQVLSWYTGLAIPSSMLVSNFIRNDEIPGEPFAVGSEGIGEAIVTIPNLLNYTRDTWINSIVHCGLRLAFKEGITSFAVEEEFIDYLEGKKVVSINFEHFIDGVYQDSEVNYNDLKLSLYKDDYNSFTGILINSIDYFKGTVAHIGKLSGSYIDQYPSLSFLVTAFENTLLTLVESENIVGEPKHTYLQSEAPVGTIFQLLFEKLIYQNPLHFQNKLKVLNYSIDYEKTFVNSITEINFLSYLVELTDNNEYVVEETIVFPTTNIGSVVSCDFNITVEDDGNVSNTATVTIEYESECQPIPDCTAIDKTVFSDNSETTLYLEVLGISDPEVLYIKITSSFTEGCGTILYDGNPLVRDTIVPIEDINSGLLIYYPNNSSEVSNCTLVLRYRTTIDALSYCDVDNFLRIINEYNPDIYDINVSFSFLDIFKCSDDILDINTDSGNLNITYTGNSTDLSYFWYEVGNDVPLNTDHSTPNFIFLGVDAVILSLTLYVVDVYGNSDAYADSFTVFNNIIPTITDPSDVSLVIDVEIYNLIGQILVDPDNIVISQSWTQVSGPSIATITLIEDLNPVFSDLNVVGIYEFLFTLEHDCGTELVSFSITTTKTITDDPPTVNAGPDTLINLPITSYGLFATANDPESLPMTFLWTIISGPSTPIFSSDTILNPIVSSLSVVGTYVLQIEATDSVLQTATDDLSIIVRPFAQHIRISSRNNINICNENYGDLVSTRAMVIENTGGIIQVGDLVFEADNITPIPTGNYAFYIDLMFENHAVVNGVITLTICA